MGNGCFCCKKKTAPTPVVVTTEVTSPKIELKDKPYGYVRLYAGARTSDNKYSSPIISLHTYNKTRKVTTRTRTTLDLSTTENTSSGAKETQAGPSSSNNTEKEEVDEHVRCIPAEDIISISYSTDIKKEFETFEVVQKRSRPPKPKLGCCGRFKESFRETFCCPRCPCKCCKPPPIEKAQYDTTTKRNTTAKRMILIEIKYIPYTNIHIPSHIQVLPDYERNNFYKEYFGIETIQFYLVNNTETDGNHFEVKNIEAEELCRVIVQLRNMSNHYPSPIELAEILHQKQDALYGDVIRH